MYYELIIYGLCLNEAGPISFLTLSNDSATDKYAIYVT